MNLLIIAVLALSSILVLLRVIDAAPEGSQGEGGFRFGPVPPVDSEGPRKAA